ncbi:hypothetical protein D2N39_09685 [Gemmobacter lutimaris]|uniref:Glycosyltransferase family 2 protein n=1 Tax=Gemmobacter lutimaris TaxID=2306023 RepID=A0A398BTC2_9RHOB|nr:hypothetical protein [Gemmobacter lutimaris]RID92171.1 hypothetical protein D2N39_09685 [Gemmobacter lutimaris]
MIVTLTSIPPRYGHLGKVFDAIGAQRHRPRAVELHLPRRYRRFPGTRPALPALPDWVTVVDHDEDWGPATKVLPAICRHRTAPVDLLFCDDDARYDPDWTARFAAMRRERPLDALAEFGTNLFRQTGLKRSTPPAPHVVLGPPTEDELADGRARRGPDGRPLDVVREPGYASLLCGFAGAMIRSDWLDERVFEMPPAARLVDDIWLSGMLELTGRKIWVGSGCRRGDMVTETRLIEPLLHHNENGMDRAGANRVCAEYLRKTFGIWP